MSDEAAKKVIRIAADVLNLPVEQVTRQTAPTNVENWDSVLHLNLVLALEAELGVQLEPEEVDKIRSVGDAIDVVAARLN